MGLERISYTLKVYLSRTISIWLWKPNGLEGLKFIMRLINQHYIDLKTGLIIQHYIDLKTDYEFGHRSQLKVPSLKNKLPRWTRRVLFIKLTLFRLHVTYLVNTQSWMSWEQKLVQVEYPLSEIPKSQKFFRCWHDLLQMENFRKHRECS